MNKTTNSERVYTAPNTWEFSINGDLAREQGYELISRYGEQGIILRRRWFGEKTRLSVSFLLLRMSAYLFFLSSGAA
jgi:hypothetical protein